MGVSKKFLAKVVASILLLLLMGVVAMLSGCGGGECDAQCKVEVDDAMSRIPTPVSVPACQQSGTCK